MNGRDASATAAAAATASASDAMVFTTNEETGIDEGGGARDEESGASEDSGTDETSDADDTSDADETRDGVEMSDGDETRDADETGGADETNGTDDTSGADDIGADTDDAVVDVAVETEVVFDRVIDVVADAVVDVVVDAVDVAISDAAVSEAADDWSRGIVGTENGGAEFPALCCLAGTNVEEETSRCLFVPARIGRTSVEGVHGSVREGEDGEETPKDAFNVALGAVVKLTFLSILVTTFPILATCFCRSQIIRRRLSLLLLLLLLPLSPSRTGRRFRSAATNVDVV